MRKISRANRALFLAGFCFYLLAFLLGYFGVTTFNYALEMLAQILIILPAVISAIIHKEKIPQMIGMKKTRFINFVLAIAVLICSYPVVMILNLLSMIFVKNAVSDALLMYLSQYGKVLTFILVAVVPAFCEEFLFRGVVYNTYRKRYPLFALFVSAVCFGLMHGNLNQMPYAIYFGLVLALMMMASDSILVPMFMHFLMNGFSTLVLFMTEDADIAAISNTTDAIKVIFVRFYALLGPVGVSWALGVYLGVLLACMCGVFGIIYLTFKMNDKNMFSAFKKPQVAEKQKPVDLWLVGFVLTMFIVFIFFR